MEIEGKIIRQYLLGNLTEKEVEEIDLRIISEPGFDEELYLAESNLMEDYLEDLLSPQETELFQKNFLSCKQRQKELENLAMLRSYSQKKHLEVVSDEKINKPSGTFWGKFGKFLTVNLHPIAAVFAVVMLLAVIGIYFFNSGETEIAELNRKDLSSISEYQNLTNLNLISDNFRDSGGTNKLSVNNLTEQVLLRLDLPVEGNAFDVRITRGGIEAANLDNIRPYQNQSEQELRLLLPSSLLTKGEYKIEARPENSSDSPVIYSFTIQ